MDVRRMAAAAVMSVAGGALLVAAGPTPAGAADQCTAQPIPVHRTEWAAHLNPAIDASGDLIAFQAGSDLTGDNPDHNFEVFLHRVSTGTTTQLTVTDSGGSSPWQGSGPTVDGAGSLVALETSGDPTGANPDGNEEVFLYDLGDDTVTQVTDTTGAGNLDPALSADGSTLVFTSPHNLAGGGANADANREVFRLDVASGAVTQLTDTTVGASSAPAVDADGARVAYVSDQDGSSEIYLYDAGLGTSRPLTDTSGGHTASPSITADGAGVAFESDQDLAGENPNHYPQVFLAQDGSSAIDQLSGLGGGQGYGSDPAITPDGSRVAFWWAGQVALVATDGSPAAAVTAFAANYGVEAGGHPAISADGRRVVVDAHLDQADGFGWDWQVTVVDCAPLAHQPDALIARSGAASPKGDGVYNDDGARQTAGGRVTRGGELRFDLRIGNDGTDPDEVTLRGPVGGRHLRVRYFADEVDVTGQVLAGTWSTGTLEPGAVTDLQLRVTATPRAAVGAVRTYRVTARSTGDGSRQDVVAVRIGVQ